MKVLAPDIRGSGRAGSGTATVLCNGKMVPSMRVTGALAVLLAKESSLTPRVKSIMVNGEMTKLTDMVPILTRTVLNMRVSGSKTCSMAMEKSGGQMALFLLEIIEMAKRMDMESTSGQTAPPMRASGKRMRSLVTGTISG